MLPRPALRLWHDLRSHNIFLSLPTFPLLCPCHLQCCWYPRDVADAGGLPRGDAAEGAQ